MALEKKILLVDDDDSLRQTLAEHLILLEHCRIVEATTGRAALELLDDPALEARPDMIVLDVGLPDMDGRDVCRLLRHKGVDCPVIMLTGQDSDADTILGLEAGANDYVTKPFRFNVLLARMRAQARQLTRNEQTEFVLGPWRFQPSTRCLYHPDHKRPVKLTDKENAILRYLLRYSGQVVSRETLLEAVWGYSDGITTHTLETHIYRLRQKIEPVQGQITLLLTDTGGYRIGT